MRSVIDSDGHVLEDAAALIEYLPRQYREQLLEPSLASLFPPLDHFHRQPVQIRGASRGDVGPVEWLDFLDFVGLETTVLYPTAALAYGKIVDAQWADTVTRAYNQWVHDTYLDKSPRFAAMGIVPMQDPERAVTELRRCVTELGMRGVMLPSNGLPAHLGHKMYWPVYEEADRLGCAIAVHGGCHDRFGFDHLNVYAPVHGLGHSFGQLVAFGGLLFNGFFDRFPNTRVAFLEGGVAWFLMALERFSESYSTHVHLDPDGELIRFREGESVLDHVRRHVDAGRIFVGCEGEEATLPFAVDLVGERPFLYSSDFPHEVTAESCREAVEELASADELPDPARRAILRTNGERFYAFADGAPRDGAPRDGAP